MLHNMGFDEVYGLRGGILAWRAEGLPVALEPLNSTKKSR